MPQRARVRGRAAAQRGTGLGVVRSANYLLFLLFSWGGWWGGGGESYLAVV